MVTTRIAETLAGLNAVRFSSIPARATKDRPDLGVKAGDEVRIVGANFPENGILVRHDNLTTLFWYPSEAFTPHDEESSQELQAVRARHGA